MGCATRFTDKYVRILSTLRYAVLVFWIALGAGLAIFVLKFVSATTQQFSPPAGTQAATARDALDAAFPEKTTSTNFNVVLQAHDGFKVTGQDTLVKFATELGTALKNEFGPKLLQYTNYYELMATNLTIIAANMISDGEDGLVLPVILDVAFASTSAQGYGTRLQSVLDRVRPYLDTSATHVTAYANGLPIMIKQVTATVQKNMGTMDAIVIPLSVVVMGITVRSLRLMILPVAGVALTLVSSFASMYFVTFAMQVSTTTPSLMMSLSIAMSIDYNLFIVSRYCEELRSGVRGPHAVATVVRTAGATITVSGLTLMVSLLGLLFLPMDMLRTFGLGCSVSVLFAMIVALTFSPALLLAFPTFFERAGDKTELPAWCPSCVKRIASRWRDDDEEEETSPSAFPTHDDGYVAYAAKDDSPIPSSNALGTVVPPNWAPSDDGHSSQSPTRQLFTEGTTLLNTNGGGEKGRRMGSSLSSTTSFAARDGSQGLPASYLTLGHAATNVPGPSTTTDEYRKRQRSVFFALRHIFKFPYNALMFLLVLGLAVGIGLQVLKFKTTDDFNAYLARGTTARTHYQHFTSTFGYSFTEPYYFLFTPNVVASPTLPTLRDKAVFDYAQGFLKRVAASTDLPAPLPVGAFSGLFAMGGRWTTHEEVVACLDAKPSCDPNLGAFLVGTASDAYRSFYTLAFLRLNPLGNEGQPFYRKLLDHLHAYRHSLQALNASATSDPAATKKLIEVANTFDIYLSGIGPDSMDAIKVIYDLFPIIIGSSCGVVLVIIGLAFRSLVVSLRSVVSIAMTEAFVFGMVVLTYQSPGIFEWMGWAAVAQDGAVSWTAPIVAFSLILGVALDYDVFLLTRIHEFIVEEGMTTQEAIVHGLCATGKIITAAGVIMAVAFFGLLLSSTDVLNILGFFMVIAVLFDTFIVRTLVVPTVMSLLGDLNWWPRTPKQMKQMANPY